MVRKRAGITRHGNGMALAGSFADPTHNKCSLVLMYSLLSAIAGVAVIASPKSFFASTFSSSPAAITLTLPVLEHT